MASKSFKPSDSCDACNEWLPRYESRTYVVEPHWHVAFGKGLRTSTLVYANSREEIAEWLKREYVINRVAFFGDANPSNFKAEFCTKNDCKPRPSKLGTLEEFLRHPIHGWWRRLDNPDLV